MPRVPRRDSQQIGTAPLPGVRAPVGAPAAAFEGNLPVGPDLTGVTRTFAKIAAEERAKADQVAVLDADNQLSRLQTDLTTRATSRRGKEALGATADVEAEWSKQVSEIEKGLTSDQQREAFRGRVGSRFQSLYGVVERHAADESRRYDDDVTKTAIDARMNDALTNYGDIEAVSRAALELRAIIRDYGGRNGVDAEVTEQRAKEQLSRLHAGVISRFLGAGDDRAATAYYEKAKGQIIGEHAANIDQALQEGSTLGAAQRAADAIIATKGITRSLAFEKAREISEPKLRRAVEQQLDTEFVRRERAEREQHDRFLGIAADYVEKGQRPPASILTQLTAAERHTMDSWRRAVIKGEPIETDWKTYYELKTAATLPSTRDQFVKTNLLAYRHKLNDTEFKELANLQGAVRKDGDDAVRGFMTDNQIITGTATLAGLFPKAGKPGGKDDDVAFAEFRRAIDSEIAAEKKRQNKEQLATKDVQSIVDTHVMRVRFGKGEIGGKDRQGRPIVDLEQIPTADRNAIAAYLHSAGSVILTSKIERMYAAQLAGDRKLVDAIAREP